MFRGVRNYPKRPYASSVGNASRDPHALVPPPPVSPVPDLRAIRALLLGLYHLGPSPNGRRFFLVLSLFS